jgi:hypothetical protein
MALPSDDDVRNGVAAIIAATAPLAKVAGRWILRFEPGQWPGLLKSPADNDRTHGYVITRVENDGRREGIGKTKRLWTYRIFALHYYETGTDASNSEKKFKAELDAVTEALDNATMIAVTGGYAKQIPDQLVRWTEDGNGGKHFGSDNHFAAGTLILEPCG